MKVSLLDPAALKAVKHIIETHNIGKDDWKKLEHTMEHEYRCKIVYEDQYGISGYMEMPDDKYTTWFLLQFGGVQ